MIRRGLIATILAVVAMGGWSACAELFTDDNADYLVALHVVTWRPAWPRASADARPEFLPTGSSGPTGAQRSSPVARIPGPVTDPGIEQLLAKQDGNFVYTVVASARARVLASAPVRLEARSGTVCDLVGAPSWFEARYVFTPKAVAVRGRARVEWHERVLRSSRRRRRDRVAPVEVELGGMYCFSSREPVVMPGTSEGPVSRHVPGHFALLTILLSDMAADAQPPPREARVADGTEYVVTARVVTWRPLPGLDAYASPAFIRPLRYGSVKGPTGFSRLSPMVDVDGAATDQHIEKQLAAKDPDFRYRIVASASARTQRHSHVQIDARSGELLDLLGALMRFEAREVLTLREVLPDDHVVVEWRERVLNTNLYRSTGYAVPKELRQGGAYRFKTYPSARGPAEVAETVDGLPLGEPPPDPASHVPGHFLMFSIAPASATPPAPAEWPDTEKE